MKYILLILICLNISCASRKVNTAISIQKTAVTEIANDTLTQKTVSLINISDTTKVIEIIYEPINPKEEYIVDNKIYKNVRIKTTKTNKGIDISKKVDSVLNQGKHIENKIITSTKQKKKIIEVDNKWIWVLIIGLVFLMFTSVLFVCYKKKYI